MIHYKALIEAGLMAGKTIYQIEDEIVPRQGFHLESFRRAYRKIRQANPGLPALTCRETNRLHSKPKADPPWLAQERKDAEARVRGEINGMVNAYCKTTDKAHRVAWARLYAEFERRADLRLPGQDKLGWIAGQGRLGDLYAIAKELVDTKELMTDQEFLAELDKELAQVDDAAGNTANPVPTLVAWKNIRHKGCGGNIILFESAPLIWQDGVNERLPFPCPDCEWVDYACKRCGVLWDGYFQQNPKVCQMRPDWEVADYEGNFIGADRPHDHVKGK